ncbi:GMP synthase [Setomelanomma holmii]|uniref:GMP synthase n=1 Tax=Setomelanomma holmii TaxID=210430 RepID=A0A9P4H349_9PLEO|nr:GMP synthase [Setomelanomma holmii]
MISTIVRRGIQYDTILLNLAPLTLVDETKEQYGSIGNLYKTFLEAGASKLEESELLERADLYVSSYDVVNKQDYPDLEKIDAVILTGSRYDAFTPGLNNWISKLVDFIRKMLQDRSRVRIIAVCFGHQIVGRAYGVMPERNDAGWEVSVTPVVLTESGKQLFGQESLALHQMHRDVLPRYSSSASVEPIGHSDHGDVQGIYVKNPSEFLERRHGSVLDEATYQDGKDRANDPHDGVTVGARFLMFLLEG